jgi:hypothetical protein
MVGTSNQSDPEMAIDHIGQAKSLSHDGHIGRAIEKLPQTDGGGIDPSAEVTFFGIGIHYSCWL